ncbi:MAG: exo-alpha-sialidase [Tidjanibacter sp.]|nr:exo-alpha-sialidase [Tidjanibacter sp.]
MKREKMFMHFGLLISLFCAACVGGTEQQPDNTPQWPITDDGVLNVYGELIDVRNVAKESVYPINSDYLYNESLPSEVAKLKCAVSVMEMRGVEKIACSQVCGVYVAFTEPINAPGWTDLGKTFVVANESGTKRMQYSLYRYKIDKPMQWVDVPQVEGQAVSTLVFAPEITVQGTESYGTLIAKVDNLRGHNVTNPSIICLPNGELLVGCNGPLRNSAGKHVVFYASKDGGKTWTVRNKGQFQMSYESTFLHNGVLYVMGADDAAGNVAIHASYDNGYTWTDAVDANSGLLLEGAFHSAPVPVAIWNGRIWRAMETNETNKKVFVMSAPVDANLLAASSWTMTNMITYDKTWDVNGNGLKGSQMIEGNVVVTPDGNLVNILRVDERRYGRTVAMVNVESSKKISFTPATGFYTMPGGGKKFTIRFDEQSGKYWAITNPADQKYYGNQAEGYYTNGITADLLRNKMSLCSSLDLKTWTVERELLHSDDPFFHGFQYVDWQFDGDDIVAVIRMAAPEERGLPNRQHDANMLSFFRVENFRTRQ